MANIPAALKHGRPAKADMRLKLKEEEGGEGLKVWGRKVRDGAANEEILWRFEGEKEFGVGMRDNLSAERAGVANGGRWEALNILALILKHWERGRRRRRERDIIYIYIYSSVRNLPWFC